MTEKPLSLLLIEDDDNDAMLIKYFLAEGEPEPLFTVTTAERLSDGCLLLKQRPFDAVILDLALPDSRGLDSLIQLRAQQPEVVVIVMTGLKDERVALDALSLGAQDYLIKGMINGYFLKRSILHAIERNRTAAQIEKILAQDPDGKVIIDQEGLICYANPAAESLLGRGVKELLGKLFTYPLPVDGCAKVRAAGPGAEERIIEVRSTAIDWHKTPARLATLRDITEMGRPRRHKIRPSRTRALSS